MSRLFVKAALAEGTSLELGPDQANHARRVMRLGMRLGLGDTIVVFNGVDGEWRALIEGTAKGRCTLRLDSRIRPQAPEPGPWLAFAALKKTAMDFVAVKATELGVSRLLPVPEVADAVPLEDLCAAWPEGRRLYLAAREAPPIAEVLARHGGGEAGFLAGPEGGFAPSELDAMGDLPFVSVVGLGPRILRAETAALADLACLQALAGDWRGSSDGPS